MSSVAPVLSFVIIIGGADHWKRPGGDAKRESSNQNRNFQTLIHGTLPSRNQNRRRLQDQSCLRVHCPLCLAGHSVTPQSTSIPRRAGAMERVVTIASWYGTALTSHAIRQTVE